MFILKMLTWVLGVAALWFLLVLIVMFSGYYPEAFTSQDIGIHLFGLIGCVISCCVFEHHAYPSSS